MNFDAERQAIITLLLQNWVATPVRLENLSLASAEDLSAGYLAAWVLSGVGAQVTLGPQPLLRFAGVLQIQIYIPQDRLDGDLLARSYANTLATLFRLQQISTIYQSAPSGLISCGVPSLAGIPRAADGWWQTTLSVPFTRQLQHF